MIPSNTLNQLQLDLSKGWFHSSHGHTGFLNRGVRRFHATLNRPSYGIEAAYWNPEREALRLRSPDPVKPWRTIACGFADDPPCLRVGPCASQDEQEHTVVLMPSATGGVHVFINLSDTEGHLYWRRLLLRHDYLDEATWDPRSYEHPGFNSTHVLDAEGMGTPMVSENKDKVEKVKQLLAAETQQALWRSAATQVTCTARDLLLTSAKKAMPKQRLIISQVSKVLQTPMGEAVFGYALGLLLESTSGPADLKRKRLASELRIGGEAVALNVILNPIREFLTGGVDVILNTINGLSLPDMPPELPATAPQQRFEARPADFAHTERVSSTEATHRGSAD